jgi:ribonuclease P protein component
VPDGTDDAQIRQGFELLTVTPPFHPTFTTESNIVSLPKLHRLRQRQDFSTVYQLGFKRTSPHLTLRALPPKLGEQDGINQSKNLQPTRLGISVSQKVSKRAVVRNRVKRQIQAAFRQLLPKVLPGWQLVVVVKPGAIGCDYEEFLRELKQLLTHAEVLNGH